MFIKSHTTANVAIPSLQNTESEILMQNIENIISDSLPYYKSIFK